MRTLKHISLLLLAILAIPVLLILNLLGRRSNSDSGVQSLFPREPEGYAIVSGTDSEAEPYPYIYVNDDGTARELHTTEREYLETPFLGPDGGRPYVKWHYRQKNGWGDIGGFLKRSRLPGKVSVNPAPAGEPSRDARREMIRRAREMGCDIAENTDGGFTITKSKMFRSDL